MTSTRHPIDRLADRIGERFRAWEDGLATSPSSRDFVFDAEEILDVDLTEAERDQLADYVEATRSLDPPEPDQDDPGALAVGITYWIRDKGYRAGVKPTAADRERDANLRVREVLGSHFSAVNVSGGYWVIGDDRLATDHSFGRVSPEPLRRSIDRAIKDVKRVSHG